MIRDYPSHQWRNVRVDGQRLRQLRAEQGLSREKLAGKTQLTPETIRRIECTPDPSCHAWTRDLLAAALNTEPASLTRPDDG